jgi:hypothetical protein
LADFLINPLPMKLVLYVFHLIMMILLAGSIHGQSLERQLLSSYGKLSKTTDFSFSATAGELSINTLRLNDLIITQGFQQPDTKTGVYTKPVTIQNTRAIPWPNPFRNQLAISFQTETVFNAFYSIYDSEGKASVMDSPVKIVQGAKLYFNTASWDEGAYYFFLKDENQKAIHTLKIIKM